ncbi:50S ribosomal protein L10 [archaeon]|nr:50S ribosomal protein L10 [archaeon]
MTLHNIDWKKQQLSGLVSLAKQYPVIAVADIKSFPSALFQRMRKQLYGKAVIRVSKQRVIKRAFTEANVQGMNSLIDSMNGSLAIIFTEMNPFELFQFLKKNKGKMPAREGMLAEEDIIVPAGDTGIPPGPALSELKAAGLKARIQGPTIMIPEDTVVTHKGQPVTKPVEATLQKLGIKPFKVGLNMTYALEAGQLFGKGILDLDLDKTFNDLSLGAVNAMNFALNISYLSTATTPILISKAFNNALNLSVEAGILNNASTPFVLGKASMQAKALNALVDWSKS